MPRVNLPTRVLYAAVAVVLCALFASPAIADGAGRSPLVRVQTTHDGRPVEGTGVIIGVDRQSGTLFVLTAAALCDRPCGEPAFDEVRVEMSGGLSATVPADHVLRPAGELNGIALLRIEGRSVTPRPGESNDAPTHVDLIALDYQEPAVGGVFVVAVAGPNAARTDVPQRVQFGATRVVVGSRAIANLPACLGAPALTEQGIFGVVVECEQGRSPVVALASSARRFLDRHLPPAQVLTGAGQSASPCFKLSERLLDGPMLTVACDAVNAGEVEVPYVLAKNERAVDATATFMNASSVRLADITVTELDDRAIKMRFTMVGVPPPYYSVPENCWRGQALVTVRMRVVTLTRIGEVEW